MKLNEKCLSWLTSSADINVLRRQSLVVWTVVLLANLS